jgi:glycosyltransferase involved in cell wall biosynthesis
VLERLYSHVRGGYRSLSQLLGEEGLDVLMGKPLLVQLIPHLVAARADIVASSNWFWSPAYCTYLARKLKRFTLVGIPFFHTAEPWWCNRPIYKRMLMDCCAVMANTSYEANFVRKQGAVRVEVCGVGIDPRSFEHYDGRKIRARYGVGNHPVVGFVGRSDLNKGAILLLQAMKRVWEWNREVRLVLAGPERAGEKRSKPLLRASRNSRENGL